MLSDEERKIETLKKYINSQEQKMNDYYKIDEEFYKDEIEQLEFSIKLLRYILNLIEKQQKEIEELKEKNKLLQENYSSAHEDINWFCENYISKKESEQKEKQAYIDGTNIADELCNKKWEDKIKAKIEEVDYKMIAHQDVREAVKQVLQSLLEKE